MSWVRKIALVVPIGVAALHFWGCSLNREGLRPETACPGANVQADITPFKHAYKITGVCSIGEESASFDISAVWNKKGNETTSAAILKVNYQGQNYDANIVGTCPQDPLLYGGNCSNRAIQGSLLATVLWVYYAQVFQTHLMPDLLSEAQKTELRAKDQWPKVPPVVITPSPGLPPNMHYHNPDNVIIGYQLPFTAGKPSDWKITFGYEKWNSDSSNWGSIIYQTIDNLYLSSGGNHAGTKSLSLAAGKYRVSWVSYRYRDSYGNQWDSGSFQVPVEFTVGRFARSAEALRKGLKMTPEGLASAAPKPLGGAADAAKAPAEKLAPVGIPAIRLPVAAFTAPALVQPEVQGDGRFKINYILEKRDNGAFRKIAEAGDPKFQVVDPGEYRIRARYEGGTAETSVPFTVKAKTLPAPVSTPPPGVKLPLKK